MNEIIMCFFNDIGLCGGSIRPHGAFLFFAESAFVTCLSGEHKNPYMQIFIGLYEEL